MQGRGCSCGRRGASRSRAAGGAVAASDLHQRVTFSPRLGRRLAVFLRLSEYRFAHNWSFRDTLSYDVFARSSCLD
ncbi:MAG TPA: hypothetical protein VEJ16_15295 [Alphaproteobacteria bacterium]|nr:hypothetical protein [Alphaproteobacteria bacterium]